jgi:hypothetical protein
MHAEDVFRYGHETLIRELESLPDSVWALPNAIGEWRVHDIVAHLAANEQVIESLFRSLLGEPPTAILQAYMQARGEDFNRENVTRLSDLTPMQLMQEYRSAHQRAGEALMKIPVETRRQRGLLAWYGEEYDLEDFILYASYGHKREHAAQIAQVRDRR